MMVLIEFTLMQILAEMLYQRYIGGGKADRTPLYEAACVKIASMLFLICSIITEILNME